MAFFNKRKSFWAYTAIFVLVCILGYSPFWTQGKSLVWKIDGLGQYYTSFLYIGQYLRKYFFNCLRGNVALPLFDISIGMWDVELLWIRRPFKHFGGICNRSKWCICIYGNVFPETLSVRAMF